MQANIRTIALALYEGTSPNEGKTPEEFAEAMLKINGLSMKGGDLLRNGKPIAHVEPRPDYRGKKTKPTVWDFYDWENYQEVERILSKAQDERNIYGIHKAEKRAENICDGTKRNRVMKEIERFVEESDALHWKTDAGTEPAMGCDPYEDPFKDIPEKEEPMKASEMMAAMGVTVVNVDAEGQIEVLNEACKEGFISDREREIETLKVKHEETLKAKNAEIKELRKIVTELDAKLAELEALRAAETCEPVPQDDDDDIEIIDQFIAEHECVRLAGETSAAWYLEGIEKNSPEHRAVKEIGGKFAKKHKKYPNCWYIPKSA